MTRFAGSFEQPSHQGPYELGNPADVLRVGNVRSAGWNVADPAADVLPSSGSGIGTQASTHRDRGAVNGLATRQSAVHRAGRMLRTFVSDHPVRAAFGAAMVGGVLVRWLVSVVRRSNRTMLRKS
jgi:hypothetical protein